MVLLIPQNRKTSKGSYLQRKSSNLLGKRDWNEKFEINHYLAICVLSGTHPFLQFSCPFQKLSLASWVSINSTQFLLGLLLPWSFNFGPISFSRQGPCSFLEQSSCASCFYSTLCPLLTQCCHQRTSLHMKMLSCSQRKNKYSFPLVFWKRWHKQ